MAEKNKHVLGSMVFELETDTTKLTRRLRAIAKHTAALADELEELDGDSGYLQNAASSDVDELSQQAKVLFVSDDGVQFRLFVDGHEVKLTRGVTIKAGGGGDVEVELTMLAVGGCETIQRAGERNR